MIQVSTTKIKGVKVIQSSVFKDNRGLFSETYNEKSFKEAGITEQFVQDNVSVSLYGVARGLHIQRNNPQGKLVRCIEGQIMDFWVDVRKDSPTYGKWECLTLNGMDGLAVYLPPGLAHGFVTLSQIAVMSYKCTTLYDKDSDGGINWRDPEIGIILPIDEMPIMSEKDKLLPLLSEFGAIEL